MFIKLNFTSDKRITTCFRLLTDIINNNSVTSVSALQSRATAASYSADLLTGFDAANSEIVRTVDTTGVKAHFAYTLRPDYVNYRFTLEFSVYDNTATKYYVQYNNTSGAASQTTSNFTIGNSITGGTMDSTQCGLGVSETYNSTTNIGTALTVGNAFTPGSVITSGASGQTTVRTFWAYMTGKVLIWGTTNATSTASGWPSAYNDATKFSGPHIIAQYTRYDYFNTDSNGIIPVLYTNPRVAGAGFGQQTDYTAVWNSEYISATTSLPFRVYNIISATPQVGTSWPVISNPYVSHVVNGRGSFYVGWNTAQVTGTVTSAVTASYGSGIASTAAYRYPTTDLTGTGFALLPLQWEATYRGNYGGNASDQGGFYIFNGDYVPGDTFAMNNKVWMCWPVMYGYVDRIGLAIPKE